MANVFEASGLFWWGKSPIPKGHLAPEDAVAGNLTVDSTGLSRLSLIGLLTPIPDALTDLFRGNTPLEEEATIHGTLAGSKGQVVLGRLRRDGITIGSTNLSHQGFAADECLLFPSSQFPKHVRRFGELEADASALADWFHFSGIEVTPRRKGYRIDVRMPASEEYQLGSQKIRVAHVAKPAVRKGHISQVRTANIAQATVITLSQRKLRTRDELREDFQLIEDSLVLLTGQRIQLPWPLLRNRSGVCTFYFRRTVDETPEISWKDCWTTWEAIKDRFGAVLTNLREGRNEWGPGLYLYLGTRRSRTIYLENRFMNLIWGLESLHRRNEITEDAAPSAFQEKIDRIIADVQKAKDKKWLAQRLANAAEPSLGQRLFELFSELNLGLQTADLRRFCDECADKRNDISHFGGERHKGVSYADFGGRVALLTELLIDLYHALLLIRIGLAPSLVRRWFFEGPRSYGYRRLFEALNISREQLPADTGAGDSREGAGAGQR